MHEERKWPLTMTFALQKSQGLNRAYQHSLALHLLPGLDASLQSTVSLGWLGPISPWPSLQEALVLTGKVCRTGCPNSNEDPPPLMALKVTKARESQTTVSCRGGEKWVQCLFHLLYNKSGDWLELWMIAASKNNYQHLYYH